MWEEKWSWLSAPLGHPCKDSQGWKCSPDLTWILEVTEKGCEICFYILWSERICSISFQKKHAFWQCCVITCVAWPEEQGFGYEASPGTWFSPAPEPQAHTLLWVCADHQSSRHSALGSLAGSQVGCKAVGYDVISCDVT